MNVLPHNEDAEKAVLGAVLLNDQLLIEIDFLHAEDFYKTGHQELFSAIHEFRQENSSLRVDIITIGEYLAKKNKLADVGGYAYLSSITSDVPTTTNISYYARIVRDMALRRRLLDVASRLRTDAFDEGHDIQKLLDEGETQINALNSEGAAGADYQVMSFLVSEAVSRIQRKMDTDEEEGIMTGFHRLDAMTGGFQPSEFIVIGARPSVGKTALALTMARHMAVRNDIRVGFFSLEMSAIAITERLLSAESQIDFKRFRSTKLLKQKDLASISQAADKLYEKKICIQDTPNMKLFDLRAQARRMARKEGVQIIFIDYIGLINPDMDSRIPRHEQIAQVSRAMKSLARELEIPIVCLSQVGRDSAEKEPTLANLRESGSIEQDADVVLLLHRPPQEKIGGADDEGAPKNLPVPEVQNIKVILAKQRNGEIGDFELGFYGRYVSFVNLESHM